MTQLSQGLKIFISFSLCSYTTELGFELISRWPQILRSQSFYLLFDDPISPGVCSQTVQVQRWPSLCGMRQGPGTQMTP